MTIVATPIRICLGSHAALEPFDIPLTAEWCRVGVDGRGKCVGGGRTPREEHHGATGCNYSEHHAFTIKLSRQKEKIRNVQASWE